MTLFLLAVLRLTFLGDVMLAFHPASLADREGPASPWRCLRPFLDSAVVVINLEAPFTREEQPMIPDKAFLFRVDPRYVRVLVAGGVRVAATANNHVMDFGVAGLRETHRTLERAGIAHVGTGMSARAARRAVILDTLGERVAFLAYSLTFPEDYWAGQDRPGTAFGHERWIRNDIRQARKEASFVVVMFHWGRERWPAPRPYQIALAHAAVEAGADLVIGHHPHVIQPVEVYRGRAIFYSLGNGLFGSTSPRPQGVLVHLTLGPDSARFEVVPLEVRPPYGGLPPHPLPEPYRTHDLMFLLEGISWTPTRAGGAFSLPRGR